MCNEYHKRYSCAHTHRMFTIRCPASPEGSEKCPDTKEDWEDEDFECGECAAAAVKAAEAKVKR